MASGKTKAFSMSDMGTKTASDTMAQGIGLAGKDGCDTCAIGGNESGKLAHCPPGCIAPAFAVLPVDFTHAPTTLSSRLSSLPAPFLRGRSALPDPYPPRSSDLV